MHRIFSIIRTLKLSILRARVTTYISLMCNLLNSVSTGIIPLRTTFFRDMIRDHIIRDAREMVLALKSVVVMVQSIESGTNKYHGAIY